MGQLLARAQVTPTHSVEFWETLPGKVLMVQGFHSAAGEQSLDLGPMLLEAGSYAALYRTLMKDPEAVISPELVAADEHRRSLPIRDAADPPAAPPENPDHVLAHGDAMEDADSPGAAPGRLQTLSFRSSGRQAKTPAALGFLCDSAETDGNYCPGWYHPSPFSTDLLPGNFYGFVYGTVTETMYWDSVGSNPQGGSFDD